VLLLTTLLAGTIVHSTPLTKFAVIGRYQVSPGVFKKNISTQQSTWVALEDGGGAAMVLEDGGGEVALGGGVGQWFKIVAVALDGGGGRRTCNDWVGVSVAEAEGYLLRHWHQQWGGRQERTRLM
jgi:hypothetical protein